MFAVCSRSIQTLLLAAALSLLCSSCGKGQLAVYPVSGQILFEGNKPPPEGAFVVFKPVTELPQLENSGNPRGIVGKDGKFQLTTYQLNDGAPAGEYEVIITWQRPNPEGSDDGRDLLGGRYRDPGKSGLPKVTVKEGKNELPPIQLRAK